MSKDKHEFEGFFPRQDRALVRVDDVVKKTPGGLIIPDFDGEGKKTSMAEKPNRGVVIALGPKIEDLEIGDHVLYGVHSGFEVSHKGISYRLIREADAFARIK